MHKKKLVLTNSAISKVQWCPRAYYYRYERNLVSNERNPHLIIGRLAHEGLAVLHREGICETSIALAIHAAHEEIEGARTRESMIARFLTERYAEFYSSELARQLWGDFEGKEVEVSFVTHIDLHRHPLDIFLAGKLDWVVDRLGEIWLVENKTASRIDLDYLAKIPTDRQISIYLYGMTHLGYNPVGAIYNVIEKPNKYMRVNESVETWLDRCTPDYLATPAKFFARQPAYRTTGQFEQLLIEIDYVGRLISKFRRDHYWPTCLAHCFIKNRECEYIPLCTRGETFASLMGFHTEKSHIELGDLDEQLTNSE